MPKGVVHYALTDGGSEAFHLTIGLHRENMQARKRCSFDTPFLHLGQNRLDGACMESGASGQEPTRSVHCCTVARRFSPHDPAQDRPSQRCERGTFAVPEICTA